MFNPVPLIVLIALTIPMLAAMTITVFIMGAVQDHRTKKAIKKHEDRVRRIEVTIRRLK